MVAATGIEPSTTVLLLFVVAFGALLVRTRYLSLRSLFCLNLLALLHCCYMERFWDMGVSVALLLEVSRKLYHILDVVCFMACCLE